MKSFRQIAEEIAGVVAKKRTAYGSRAPHVLRALYPEGIPPERLGEGLWVARIVDKLCRIAHGAQGALGEDAWVDIAGYALVHLHDRQRNDD